MGFRGEFVELNKGGLVKNIIPNTVVQQGQQRILEAAFQNLTTLKPLGTLEIALIDEVPAYGDLIAAITTEPTSAGGYARQTLTPVIANWVVDSVNGEARVTSAVVSFTATGADYSRTYSRYMLSEASAEIISYSSPISAPRLILDGETVNTQYRMYNQ